MKNTLQRYGLLGYKMTMSCTSHLFFIVLSYGMAIFETGKKTSGMKCNSNDKRKAWGVALLMLLLSCGYLFFLGYRLCAFGEW